MTTPAITTIPAAPGQLAAVAALAISEHESARGRDPLLGPITDHPEALRTRLDGLSGTVALRGGEVLGAWLATSAGGAQAAPLGAIAGDLDGIRAAYTAQASTWVAAGEQTHTAVVRAADQGVHDALVDLGFGHEQAYGVLDLEDPAAAVVAPSTRPGSARAEVVVRPGVPTDLDDVVRLAPIIGRHQKASPVFARVGADFFDQLAAAHRAELADPEAHYLVARVAGEAVGFAIWYDGESGPFMLAPAVELSVAATDESARGHGVGLALTTAVVAEARQRGARYLCADWRTTNLLASHFWQARGLRVVGHRMSRTIDAAVG